MQGEKQEAALWLNRREGTKNHPLHAHPREAMAVGWAALKAHWEGPVFGCMLGSRKWESVQLHVLQDVLHPGLSHSPPSPYSLSWAALGLKPSPAWGLTSSWRLPGSGQLPLTCEQAWPTDLQLEVELVFHGVGHIHVQKSCQAQLVPGVQGPAAEAMPVFAGKGTEGRRRRRAARTKAEGEGGAS